MRIVAPSLVLLAMVVAPLAALRLELPYGVWLKQDKDSLLQLRLYSGRRVKVTHEKKGKPALSAQGWYKASRKGKFSFELWMNPVEVTNSSWPTDYVNIMNVPIWQNKKIKLSVDYLDKGNRVKLCLHYIRIEGIADTECATLSKKKWGGKTGEQ